MSEFRKLVENVLKENDFDWAAFDSAAARQLGYENEMDNYVEELISNGEVNIDDKTKQNKFFDYIYSIDDDIGFDPEDLRKEGNLIYLA